MTGREPLVLLSVGAVLLVVSGIGPHDRTTWRLEVAPILIAVPILVVTARRFPLTPLAYRLIFVHALILMLGGHYTYAEVPVGLLGEARARPRPEPLRPGRPLRPGLRSGHRGARGPDPALPGPAGPVVAFLVLCVCLAISALYELVEWWAALIGGEGADAFLGTQGDQWDTQWDMFVALLGAATALLVLSRLHDRQITRLEETTHV